jgi:hypothetical protein
MIDFTLIKTNGIKLRAVVKGEGPLLILVHGFPETSIPGAIRTLTTAYGGTNWTVMTALSKTPDRY